MAKIEKSLVGYEMGSEIAVTTLLMNLAAFISILRRHIYREDQLFFPMAEAELSENERETLQGQFDQEEAAMDGESISHRNQKRLQEMAALISTV
jgi:hemerythrin-like domain-containing protein